MAATPALPSRIGAVAAGVLYVVADGTPGFEAAKGFAANGFDDHSPGGYTLLAALVTEAVLTGFFLYLILGATDGRAPMGFAPLAIGLALTLIHLISLPVANTSVNPARSTGVAPFAGSWAMSQLWLFWLASLIGAAIAGVTYAPVTGERLTTPVKGEARTSET
jgi:aquaporin Z